MSRFKDQETATSYGGLDDAAFNDGDPVSAHVMRELCRQGNRLISKSDLIFRQMGRFAQEGETQTNTEMVMFAHPNWHHLIPVNELPVPKPYGFTKARLSVVAQIPKDSSARDRVVHVVVGTRGNGGLEQPLDNSKIHILTGTGSTVAYEFTDVVLQRQSGEVLSFYIRGIVDHLNDPQPNQGTYGGPNGGIGTTKFAEHDVFTYLTATDPGFVYVDDNTSTTTISRDGHYVVFYQSGTTRIVHGPCRITGVESGAGFSNVSFAPAYIGNKLDLWNTDFEVLESPKFRLFDVALYTQQRNPV